MFGKRQTMSDNLFDTINVFLSILILLIVVYPLYFIIIASFSDPSAVNSGKVWIWPSNVNLEGYIRVLKDIRVWRGYRTPIL
jgi:putative aldouronate transport system permease protein